MRQKEDYPIDIVIPWVDGSDPEWIREKNKKAEELNCSFSSDFSDVRFRDWDIIRYLFCSIDLYAPWVNTVHFVTWGHLPKWMNPEAPKLHIVNHKDFIPQQYLPTFSSHTIELNMHRIPGLAEHFIYFNDDMLLLRPTKRTDFFKKGLPCDYAVLNVLSSPFRGSVADIALTDIEAINDHFRKNEVIRKHFMRWFHPVYGEKLLRTLWLLPVPLFLNFYWTHTCTSFLKSIFYKVWLYEYDLLDSTCRHPFRTCRDANQWLIREWQLCEGAFIPISPKNRETMSIRNNNDRIRRLLEERKKTVICLNENRGTKFRDVNKTMDELYAMLAQSFPSKSSFEV